MKNIGKKIKNKNIAKIEMVGKIAAKLFNNKGFLETSMEDIATAAKMSKGGIYHYFSNKDEILYFILNKYMDLLLGNLEEDLKRIDGNHSKIKFITSRHIAIYAKYLNEGKTLLNETPLLPQKYYKIIAEKEKKYYRIIANILSDFFDGHIEKGKLTVLTFTLLGMCNWIHSWYNPKGSVSPQELSEIICNVFFNGINKLKRI